MKFSKEWKIGSFVVIVLVVSFFVINYLRGKDIFNKEIELVAYYENLEGLTESAPVFIKGYKAGKVNEVEYVAAEGNFKVTCSIMKEFAIPEDSKMTIYAVDIMGGKGIRIDPGSSEIMAGDGAELAPAFEAGLLDGLASQITPLMAKVNNTLDSLTVTVAGVNQLLGAQNQEKISSTLAHLERTMADVSSIADCINGKSDELNAFIDNLAGLSAKLNVIAEKVDTTIDGVNVVVDGLEETDIKGVVESFKVLLENINDPDGTIGKLLVDGSVYDSLDALLTDVDSLVRKIEENPKKYMKLSVF